MNKVLPVISDSPLRRTSGIHNRTLVIPQSEPRVRESFSRILENQRRDTNVRLSTHAQERLRQQNITISPQDISMISDATRKAEMKGSKESLILLRDLALVVNIKNKTVITAVDKARQKDRIFTNIDSTVIL